MKETTYTIAENRKARFNYFIEDTIECGIVLEGTEVKSIKDCCVSFNDSFAEIIDGEVWVRNFQISEYRNASIFNHSPNRLKKLLLHKHEIRKLSRKVEEKGYTLVPLKLYVKSGLVKMELGICKGKKLFDKKETVKKRDLDKEISREFKK